MTATPRTPASTSTATRTQRSRAVTASNATATGSRTRKTPVQIPIEADSSSGAAGTKVRRIGGVAPFVAPPGRFAQRRVTRTWGRRGFVPLSPGREKRRHRILPRTVIGISSMLLALGVGAAFAGASFYAYYDNRLAQNEQEVARFVDGFDAQFTDASGSLEQLRLDSVDEIRAELAPLGDYTTDAKGVLGLPGIAGPSVWLVETRSESGQPVAGAAFAVTGHEGGTALVTSLQVVMASTVDPGPGITLVKGDQRLAATLWAWDPVYDLALLLVDESIPLLEVASPSVQRTALGGRVFAMSGLGGQGATASPGVLIDRSPSGLQHTATIGSFFEGGPLLDGEGRVIGVATSSYRPFGIDPGPVAQAPDIEAVCSRVLRCADVRSDLSVQFELGEAGN